MTVAERLAAALADRYRVERELGRREPLVTLGTEPPRPRWRLAFFGMADDPHVYAYVAAAYRSKIFTVDGVR